MNRRSEETVSLEHSAPRRAAPRVARLTIVFPPGLKASFALGEQETVLGRGDGGLAVVHQTVSRRHAAIRWDDVAGRHAVRDLDSRNGTWLAGQRLQGPPRYMDDGAVLRIGDVLAVYERQDGAVVDPPQVSRSELAGEALSMQVLRAAVARAAVDPSPALVLGETGVGKERVAGELHRLSGRRGPLLSINCSALAAHLVESQLFGHVRGAFTGATGEHAGLFRAASGGTLFLDEFGELPLDLQPKLLRAVELGEVLAVGSTQRHQVDVRLIAATNRSLLEEVEAGRFRRDLYARFALWELRVPTLAARRVDLLDWIDRLHRTWSEQRGRGQPARLEFKVGAAEQLLLAPWRDNLRGLQRCVHELAGRAEDGPIAATDLPAWLRASTVPEDRSRPGAAAPDRAVLEDRSKGRPVSTDPGHVPEDRPGSSEPTPPGAPPESYRLQRVPRPRPTREELQAALEAHGWSIRATARHFDRERKQISRWIEMYNLTVLTPDED
ncbi:sigma 54-interacting transcriptional regulator [Nannocystis punicea]|uniref:Sigma 54-interacting transcriptional regulator n=1 Tax=Nannocystis punicea TaxID=2995304 RepID=A0ABY7GXR8_9BACT|nr:sigma 54-interacting transcriptional regulator [Nannocystis poenicansa]WAS91770.1 sigma 54-interacting transcriptional regulator [Nannocystis poenicansa]